MSRWSTDDEIKPATVAGSFAAHVRVIATCSHCHRDSILDLDAMVAAGQGLKPLLSLPFGSGSSLSQSQAILVGWFDSGKPD